jgi:hypothetical protein
MSTHPPSQVALLLLVLLTLMALHPTALQRFKPCILRRHHTSPSAAFRHPIKPSGIYDQGTDPLSLIAHIEFVAERQQHSSESFRPDNEEEMLDMGTASSASYRT